MTRHDGPGGLIGTFVRHRTAANLLMAVMLLAGVVGLSRINTQFFPDFGIDIITVSVTWPGASAEDADLNIAEAVIPEVRFLDDVRAVRSTAREGGVTVTVEFEPGADMQQALSAVESAVSRLTTLPEDSEKPVIRRVVRYDTLSRVVIAGPYPESALKALARQMRDQLLDRGIDRVDLVGVRDDELWVELSEAALRRLDITPAEVAARIREHAIDLPLGEIEGANERQVRMLGQVDDALDLADIEVRSTEDGRRLVLSDIARVSERPEKGGVQLTYDGQPAVELHIQRATTADALEQADKVAAWLAEIRPTLPPNLQVVEFDVLSDMIRDRIRLLLENGAGGLVLVVVVLFVFLNGRVAFWVAVGIPTALMAAIGVMLLSGQTINMVSLFALILTLGIVVDDAIVVGEHAETQRRLGLDPRAAAERGAGRMIRPVLSSSLTTLAAFLPLFLISDIIGQIIIAIPLVVVAVILASLLECFYVLPGHLGGALVHDTYAEESRFRHWFNRNFDRFRDGPVRRLVRVAVAWRYVTVALAVAAFVISIGVIAGGRVGFVFFDGPEADKVYANIAMVAGTPRADTEAQLAEAVDALYRAEAELAGDVRVVDVAIGYVGTSVGGAPGSAGSDGDEVAGLVVELVPSDTRNVRTQALIDAWTEAVRPLPGLERFSAKGAMGGPPGRDLDLRLYGDDPAALKAAALEIQSLVAGYPGISDLSDDLPHGKEETILDLTPRGEMMGFTTRSVGDQVRNALEGAIAVRFARGEDEVTIRVLADQAAGGIRDLHGFRLRGPGGAEVPLESVVDLRQRDSFARIQREDGRRQVAITAEINKDLTTSAEVEQALARDGLVDIAQRHGITWRFAGKAEERERTFGDMKLGAMVGLGLIYIILAWVFASYSRPLVVMTIIPLAFVGAVAGHWLLGYNLTILTMVAMIGLSGVVINDSIILVGTIVERLDAGESLMDAAVHGTCDRLRAVILTSLTTIGGLTPLLFETSLQARFLIPMAVTIVFGLMVTTLLVLFVVPALLMIVEDLARLVGRRPQRVPASAEA